MRGLISSKAGLAAASAVLLTACLAPVVPRAPMITQSVVLEPGESWGVIEVHGSSDFRYDVGYSVTAWYPVDGIIGRFFANFRNGSFDVATDSSMFVPASSASDSPLTRVAASEGDRILIETARFAYGGRAHSTQTLQFVAASFGGEDARISFQVETDVPVSIALRSGNDLGVLSPETAARVNNDTFRLDLYPAADAWIAMFPERYERCATCQVEPLYEVRAGENSTSFTRQGPYYVSGADGSPASVPNAWVPSGPAQVSLHFNQSGERMFPWVLEFPLGVTQGQYSWFGARPSG